MAKHYSLGTGKMVECKGVPVQIGDVLTFEGYGYNQLVVVQIKGEAVRSYSITNPEDNAHLTHSETWSLKHISEEFGIGIYLTDELRHTPEQVAGYLEDHMSQAKAAEQAKDEAKDEADRLEAIGAELWHKLIGDCKAYIVANLEQDECDMMTDYFATSTTKTVILAPSKHCRDLFPELRKAAKLLPETEHYGIKPVKPADASEWWTPGDEHREKHSMGAGYYLGADRYSSGWKISKRHGTPGREAFIQLALKHDHLTAKAKAKPAPAPEKKAPSNDPRPSGPGLVYIIDYSEKACAIIGDTKPIKDQLKEMGARFNFRLSCGPGWIIPKARRDDFADLVAA